MNWQQLNPCKSIHKRGYANENGDYQSITSFLGKYPNDPQHLIKWCYDNYSTFEEYQQGLAQLAKDGTALHKEIEEFFKGERRLEDTPEGFQNFLAKHNYPEVIDTEFTVYDDELALAGTCDALLEIEGKKVCIDWKSSKKARRKQEAQGAFYAKNCGADEAWIVFFGGEQKRGYGVKKIDIDRYYKKVCLLKELIDT